MDAAFRHRSFTFDNRCQQRALSCSVLASFLVPLFTLALVSALFLLGRLWYLRRRYLRIARSRPQDVVPTAGSIIGDVVGLGKTLMATALARIYEDDHNVETLILCPKNLVPMWEDYRQQGIA